MLGQLSSCYLKLALCSIPLRRSSPAYFSTGFVNAKWHIYLFSCPQLEALLHSLFEGGHQSHTIVMTVIMETHCCRHSVFLCCIHHMRWASSSSMFSSAMNHIPAQRVLEYILSWALKCRGIEVLNLYLMLHTVHLHDASVYSQEVLCQWAVHEAVESGACCV